MTRGRWHRTVGLLLALAAGTLLAGGCTYGLYRAYASPAYVPNLDRPDSAMSLDELEFLYTTSPDYSQKDTLPSGYLWSESTMRLLTPEIQRRREEFKRQSYSRTAAEQREALESVDKIFKTYLVFEGKLVSSIEDYVDIRRYGPEGIFLLDDRGNKFLPVETTLGFHIRPRGETITPSLPYRQVDEKLGTTWRAHPLLMFPRQAIGPETRAISLYLAQPYWRTRFTWVFDPAYAQPRHEPPAAEYRSGLEQLFRSP